MNCGGIKIRVSLTFALLGEATGVLTGVQSIPTVIESVILGDYAGNVLGTPTFPKPTIKPLLLGGPQIVLLAPS